MRGVIFFIICHLSKLYQIAIRLVLLYLSAVEFAPVVQWIEQIRPKDKMGVRFSPGAQEIITLVLAAPDAF